MAIIEGDRRASSGRYLIVVARFNKWITERLLSGAMAKLKELGCAEDAIDVAWVPGSFELPIVARVGAETKKYRAVICLGAVIKGETTHDEHVASGCVAGIQKAMQETGVPIMLGVITADNVEKAEARSVASGGRNMGADAASAAVETVSAIENLRRTAGA
jgi:6,7-dimethyl-8-ribityllumazine synthase